MGDVAWDRGPEVPRGSVLPEDCWRSQPESGESSCKIIHLMKRMGCAKSLWSRRNIASELPSTSVGLGFCKLPKPHTACGMFAVLQACQRQGKAWGCMSVGPQQGKNGVISLFVQRVLGRAKDTSARRL